MWVLRMEAKDPARAASALNHKIRPQSPKWAFLLFENENCVRHTYRLLYAWLPELYLSPLLWTTIYVLQMYRQSDCTVFFSHFRSIFHCFSLSSLPCPVDSHCDFFPHVVCIKIWCCQPCFDSCIEENFYDFKREDNHLHFFSLTSFITLL